MPHVVTFILGSWVGGAIVAIMNVKRLNGTREE